MNENDPRPEIENEWVAFGEVASRWLGQRTDHASRYIDGLVEGYPNLGEGLRFSGDENNLQKIKIHKDDIDEFVRRVKEYKEVERNNVS